MVNTSMEILRRELRKNIRKYKNIFKFIPNISANERRDNLVRKLNEVTDFEKLQICVYCFWVEKPAVYSYSISNKQFNQVGEKINPLFPEELTPEEFAKNMKEVFIVTDI